jgi:hypothetical protein
MSYQIRNHLVLRCRSSRGRNRENLAIPQVFVNFHLGIWFLSIADGLIRSDSYHHYCSESMGHMFSKMSDHPPIPRREVSHHPSLTRCTPATSSRSSGLCPSQPQPTSLLSLHNPQYLINSSLISALHTTQQRYLPFHPSNPTLPYLFSLGPQNEAHFHNSPNPHHNSHLPPLPPSHRRPCPRGPRLSN